MYALLCFLEKVKSINDGKDLSGLERRLSSLSPQARLNALKMQASSTGDTALHYAARYGELKRLKNLLSFVETTNVFSLLKIQNWSRETALHQAAASGQLEVVQYMLDQLRGTERLELLLITDVHDRVAKDWAIANNNIEVALLLEDNTQKEINPTLKERKFISFTRI